jgi:hypothetical protein
MDLDGIGLVSSGGVERVWGETGVFVGSGALY